MRLEVISEEIALEVEQKLSSSHVPRDLFSRSKQLSVSNSFWGAMNTVCACVLQGSPRISKWSAFCGLCGQSVLLEVSTVEVLREVSY